MRSTKIIAALFIFSIAFCGCRKEVLEVNSEFEGEWSTGYNYWPWAQDDLTIKSDGSANFSAVQTFITTN